MVAWNQAPDCGKGKKNGRRRGKKEKKTRGAKRALVPGENFSQFYPKYQIHEIGRGEPGSKRVKLNINNNTPKTIKATGVLLINRTDKETFSFWGFNVL